jgi:ribosomal protein S8
MVRVSVLHDALKTMYNAEKRGKRQVLIRPASKVVIKFLQLMMKHGYIGEFEYVDDHRAGKIVINLNGRLNKCGCISPRYDVGHEVRCLSVYEHAPLAPAQLMLAGLLEQWAWRLEDRTPPSDLVPKYEQLSCKLGDLYQWAGPVGYGT